MKTSISLLACASLLAVLGCAHSGYYSQTTTTYQEPATAPLTPTGRQAERVYTNPTSDEHSDSPAVIVEPSPAEMTASDLAIGDSIRRMFESDPNLSASVQKVIISVHGGTVRLLGPVGSKADEQAILDKLRNIPGVTQIRDELQLRPSLE